MRLLKVTLALGAMSLAAPSAAKIQPSPLADASYNDCFEAASKDGMKPAALSALGWSRGTNSSDGGKSDGQDPILFGHATRKPLIMLTAEKGDGLCIVLARLENAGAFDEFKKAWGGKLPAPDKDGTISFAAEGQLIQLRRTGSAQEPSLSILVATPMDSH